MLQYGYRSGKLFKTIIKIVEYWYYAFTYISFQNWLWPVICSAGLRTYRRPDGKSGGHGVGWSPMTPYSFKVPQDWEEVSFISGSRRRSLYRMVSVNIYHHSLEWKVGHCKHTFINDESKKNLLWIIIKLISMGLIDLWSESAHVIEGFDVGLFSLSVDDVYNTI